MKKILQWFCENEPKLMTALQKSHHNFKEGVVNPFHIEGDCWSHTMMVCKIAEIKGYDEAVQVSALLHDIGKPACRATDECKGFVFYTGHEEVSADMALPILEKMYQDKIITRECNIKRCCILIASHADLYRLSKQELIEKYKGRHRLFKTLCQLVECDIDGSFATMGGVNWDMIEGVKEKLT